MLNHVQSEISLELGAVDLCCGLGIPGMSGFPKHPVLGKSSVFTSWQGSGASATYDIVNVVVFAAMVIMGL